MLRVRTCGLVVSALFLGFSFSARAEFIPRDLNQDPFTVEAYYDTELDITLLANPNLALLERFGIKDASRNDDCRDGIFCKETVPGIDKYGLMEWPTADKYIAAMNAAGYLGQSDWRLPSVTFAKNSYFTQYYDEDVNEIKEVIWARHMLHLPEIEIGHYRYISGNYHPEKGRTYTRHGYASALETGPTDGLTRFAVWPVLDGDPGNPVDTTVLNACADPDGDGFGWNGTTSCVATDYSFYSNSIQPLQPRNLDENPATVEAYYHPQLDITWLADSRLAATGIATNDVEVNTDGSFQYEYHASRWLDNLNEMSYLGHSEWRMPVARDIYAYHLYSRSYDTEISDLSNKLTQLKKGTGAGFNLLEGRYFETSRWRVSTRIFDDGGVYVTEWNWRESNFAWPVHDGDIGTAVTPVIPCIDSDGDGWGWNGTRSCKP